MLTQTNVALLTTDQLEAAWEDTCPACKVKVSALKHDYHLCSVVKNLLYRITQLEAQVHATSIYP